MQTRDKLLSGRSAGLGRAASAFAAVSAISFCCNWSMVQDASAQVPARTAPVAAVQASAAPAASAQASAGVAPAAPVQAAQAPAAAAPSSTGSTGSNLPAINVNAEQKQKPVQRQVMTQGPKREPIKIPVNASGCKAARSPGKPYFVEFRSRTAVSYGHTFVFHGRLGDGNRFASYQVAGLHPKGDDPNIYMQGMMVPVESETGASWGDLDEQYLTGRFCVTLTEAEYRKALAYIKHLQATKKTWHATTYNCNAFAADIARAYRARCAEPEHVSAAEPSSAGWRNSIAAASRATRLQPVSRASSRRLQRKRSRSAGLRLSGPRSRRRSSASSKAASLSSEMKRPASLRAFLHLVTERCGDASLFRRWRDQ